jgi:hypothetical protein
LIVAAQAVSAATAQLITSSTVKTDLNSDLQKRLQEASRRVSTDHRPSKKLTIW